MVLRSFDPGRATAGERAAYIAGRSAGRAESLPRGWQTTEFWVVSAVMAFGMWAGYRTINDSSVDLERVLAIVGMVAGIAGYYVGQRTRVKKEIVKREAAE